MTRETKLLIGYSVPPVAGISLLAARGTGPGSAGNGMNCIWVATVLLILVVIVGSTFLYHCIARCGVDAKSEEERKECVDRCVSIFLWWTITLVILVLLATIYCLVSHL
jgi:heme/copper-type cytochrome/quinol oxidase subunit 2